jgi:hypothetical protein
VASCPSGEYPGEFVDLDRSSPTLDSVGSLTALLLNGSPSYRRVIVDDLPSPIIDLSGSHVEDSRKNSGRVRDASEIACGFDRTLPVGRRFAICAYLTNERAGRHFAVLVYCIIGRFDEYRRSATLIPLSPRH